jgi:hypothetical protein
MKVRYLDVDLADDLFGLTDDRHVLVPLEAVELRERSEDVWVQGVPGHDIAALPAYLGGPVDPLLEEATERAFGTSYAPSAETSEDVEDAETERPALPPAESEAPPPLVVRDAEFAQPPSLRAPDAYPDDVPPRDDPDR